MRSCPVPLDREGDATRATLPDGSGAVPGGPGSRTAANFARAHAIPAGIIVGARITGGTRHAPARPAPFAHLPGRDPPCPPPGRRQLRPRPVAGRPAAPAG